MKNYQSSSLRMTTNSITPPIRNFFLFNSQSLRYSFCILSLLLSLTIGTAWGGITLISYGDSFSPALPTASNSVNTTSTAHTVKGLAIKEQSIYKGSTANYIMFVQNKGFLYNTSSLGTITKVAVTYSSGSSTSAKTGVYFGNSEKSTYTTTSNATIKGQSQTDEWTNSTNGNGFFQLSTSNKNCQITQIQITYLTEVTLNKNEGVDNGAVKYDHLASELYTSSFTEVTRSGYTCTGYWTASSGGTKILNANGSLAAANLTVNSVSYTNSNKKWVYAGGTLTLYAQWEATASCSNSITITKGTPEHGLFDMTGAGDVCIDGSNASVTISNIEPAEGYRFKQITSSGGGSIDNDLKAVTNISENTTINVEFEEIPSFTVSFVTGTGNSAQADITEASAGAGITLPAAPSTIKCSSDGWVFAGWSETNVTSSTTTAPALLAAGDTYHPTDDITLYAVYKQEAGSGLVTQNFTITFDNNSTDASSVISANDFKNYVTTNADKVSSFSSITKCYKGATGIKISSGSYNGSFTLNLSESLAIKQVDLNTKKKSTGTSASNGVSVGTTAFSTSSSYSSTSFVDLVFTGTKTTSSAITIVSTCSTSEGTSADGRVSWLKSIKIYYEANVTTYNYLSAPTCCEPLTAFGSSLESTAKTQTSVTLGWTNESTASDVDHYELSYIVKGASGDPTVASSNIANNVYSYTVSGLTCGTEYTFTLDAIGNAHCNAQEVLDVTTNEYHITTSAIGGGLVLTKNVTDTCNGEVIDITANTPDGSHEGNGVIKVIKTGVAPEVDVTTTVYNSGTGKLTMPAYDITISATYAEKTSPSVGVDIEPAAFDFGSPKKGASLAAQTFNLTGSALEAGTLTLVAPSGYTVSPSSIDVATGALSAQTITVTPSTENAGTFNGNISISGAGVSSTNIVALSMTVQETYTVNWYINNDATPYASQTDVVNTALVVPDDFSSFTDCNDFVFRGWTTAGMGSTAGQSAPAGMITNTEGMKISAVVETNYYAVFAEKEGDDMVSWDLVTNASSLQENDIITFTSTCTYVFSKTTYYDTVAYAGKNGDLGAVVPIGITDNKIREVKSGSLREVKLESGDADGKWKLYDITDKYISGGNKKFLYNETTGRDASITIDENSPYAATVKFGTSDSLISYNPNNNAGTYSAARFAHYSGVQKAIQIYKKTITSATYSNFVTVCPHYKRVNLSAADVSNGSISFEVSGSPVTNVRTDGGADVEVDVVIASHDTGYGLSGVELSGVVGATYSNGIITIPANAEGTLVATATFAQANYTVTLNQSPAVGATLVGGTTEAHYGDPISLSTDIPANAFFVNWTSDDVTITNPTSATGASFTMPDGNVTVTANFNEIHNVAWAIENTPSTGSLSNVYVKGIVTNITEINTSYNNATYYISDLDENGAPVNFYLVFRAKREGNTNYTSTDQLKEGDEVTVFGSLKTYNSTKEFDQGCYIITDGRTAATFNVVVSGTADKTDYYANETFAYAGLTAKAEYNTGYKKDVTAAATWTANNTASYTVTAAGTVNVTATWNETTSANYPVAVTVTTKVLESITLSETALTGYLGQALPKPTTVTAHFDDNGVKSTENVTAFARVDEDNEYDASLTTPQTITVKYSFGLVVDASETYTVTLSSIRNTLTTAYSVEQGREFIDLDNEDDNNLALDDADNKVFVLGRITAISGSTYTIKDNANDDEFIEIYEGTLSSGISSVEVGDLIKVEGNLFYYENNSHTVFKYQIKNGEIVWKQPKVGITIADKTLEVGDEPWTIVATIDPAAAPVTYSIKEGSDACLTLSGDVITATAEGTATIIAHANEYSDGVDTYLANEKEFTVTVNPAAVHTNVVLYAAYDDGDGVKYYALNNAAGATEINIVGGKVVVADEATKNAIVWDRAERTDALGDYAIFYNAAVDKYLTTGSSNSMAVGASADWYWNSDGYYEKNSGRTFIYRASAGGFKDYSTGNARTSDYADYTVIYTGEVVVGEIVELRATSAGRYGTICWPKRIEAIEGGMFFNAVGKDDAKVYLEDAPAPYTAGTPYFFLSESESLKGVVSGDDAPAGTNGALVGTLSDMYQSDIDAAATAAGSDVHIVAGNMLWTVNGQSDNQIPANRAYLLIGNVPNINNVPAPAPGRRRLSVGISQPEHTPTGLEDNVADMQGVHKFMQNGKLYIIRNGKMYDAQGKMVK